MSSNCEHTGGPVRRDSLGLQECSIVLRSPPFQYSSCCKDISRYLQQRGWRYTITVKKLWVQANLIIKMPSLGRRLTSSSVWWYWRHSGAAGAPRVPPRQTHHPTYPARADIYLGVSDRDRLRWRPSPGPSQTTQSLRSWPTRCCYSWTAPASSTRRARASCPCQFRRPLSRSADFSQVSRRITFQNCVWDHRGHTSFCVSNMRSLTKEIYNIEHTK